MSCVKTTGRGVIPAPPRRSFVGQRLAALFLLGWLMFNRPLLSLFNRGDAVFGVPLLYAYLFAAWALFIALLAFIAPTNARRDGSSKASPVLKD